MSQEKTYNFPVFGTQGGGLVREIKTDNGYKYIFVEAPPEGMELGIGDFMPEMWGIIPANQQAREAIHEEQFGDGDPLYDHAMREYLHRGSVARQLDPIPEMSRTDFELDMISQANERP